MQYAPENAFFQWQQGESRVRDAEPAEVAELERATAAVGDGLRRRLGSSFELAELVSLYAEGTEWAEAVASRAGLDAATVVDAAFSRYAREAADFAGGRLRPRVRD